MAFVGLAEPRSAPFDQLALMRCKCAVERQQELDEAFRQVASGIKTPRSLVDWVQRGFFSQVCSRTFHRFGNSASRFGLPGPMRFPALFQVGTSGDWPAR